MVAALFKNPNCKQKQRHNSSQSWRDYCTSLGCVWTHLCDHARHKAQADRLGLRLRLSLQQGCSNIVACRAIGFLYSETCYTLSKMAGVSSKGCNIQL